MSHRALREQVIRLLLKKHKSIKHTLLVTRDFRKSGAGTWNLDSFPFLYITYLFYYNAQIPDACSALIKNV